MRAGGGGRIVNVSSITGRVSSPFAGHYTAAKHAFEALSDALRMEVAGAVQVILVEPGGFKTGIWAEVERDIDKRKAAGSRYVAAYRRSLQGQRLIAPIMGDPEGCEGDRARRRLGCRALRHLVGRDAQAMLLADSLTPTFVKDRVIRFGLGI